MFGKRKRDWDKQSKPVLFGRCVLNLAFSIVVVLSSGTCNVAFSQLPEIDQPITEEDLDAIVDDIRDLVLPQQKQWARKIIREQPGSPLAKAAQDLLDKYKLYDAVKEREFQQQEMRAAQIRAYWKAQYPPMPQYKPIPMSITNETDQTVIYQIKGPGMEWANPVRLRAGETHNRNFTAAYRRFTETGERHYRLRMGVSYVFRWSPSSGETELFRRR